MNVVLAGNPNAGKTTLFNALTKSNLRTGNFHGVTTSPARKKVNEITYSDVPGMYSFTPYTMEEQSAVDEVKNADIVINVVDALTLENGLRLTEKIIGSGVKTVVYVTKTSALKRRGGKLDCGKLSSRLGVPVLDCSPKKLKEYIQKNTFPAVMAENIPFNAAYSSGKIEISLADRLFYNGAFSLAAFIISVILMFFLAFHPLMPGAFLKDLVEKLICEDLNNAIVAHMSNEALISLVSEGILSGAGGVLSFLPQLFILYLVLTLLDESGITSVLAFTTDGIFEKARLSGRASFSLVSGFGCTAAAILTTRGYATVGAQKRTIAILPFIPCGAKLPVFLTFLSPFFTDPFPVITCFYFAGVLFAIIVSLALKGGNEGMISEVTPITFPNPKATLIKLFFQLKGFIIKVACVVTLFCVISWFFSHFSITFKYVDAQDSMLSSFSKIILPLFKPMGIDDWRIAYAALCGFIAKENVAATVGMLLPAGTGLGLAQSLAMCTFMLLCPACVSAFSASCKEVGFKFTLKCFVFQLIAAFIGGYIINFVFSL